MILERFPKQIRTRIDLFVLSSSHSLTDLIVNYRNCRIGDCAEVLKHAIVLTNIYERSKLLSNFFYYGSSLIHRHCFVIRYNKYHNACEIDY